MASGGWWVAGRGWHVVGREGGGWQAVDGRWQAMGWGLVEVVGGCLWVGGR